MLATRSSSLMRLLTILAVLVILKVRWRRHDEYEALPQKAGSCCTRWKRTREVSPLLPDSDAGLRKAVKWNSPFYGIEGQGWFLGFHVFTHYVKVAFFRGTSLRPVPPGGTVRSKDARWIDIREGDQLDEAQMATWVKQAAALPGWVP